MDLHTAVAAVRNLDDLQEARRAQIIRDLMSAPTTGRWTVIAEAARREAIQARLTLRAVAAEEWRARAAGAPLSDPVRPVQPPEAIPRRPVTASTSGPVTVRWVEPTKPIQIEPESPDGKVCPEWHPHGNTTTCYTSHKCKCLDCRTANTDRARAKRNRAIDPGTIRHGTNYSYERLGCRCNVCVDAHRVYLDAKYARAKAREGE